MADRTSSTAGAPRAGAGSKCDGPHGVAAVVPERSVPGEPSRGRYCLHGPVVEIECGVPSLQPRIDALLGALTATKTPSRAAHPPVTGSILPYDVEEVLRSVSPTAVRVPPAPGGLELTEVYEEGERYWLVDDRWGLAEINLIKGQWRSWVLPDAATTLDPGRRAERAVLWPLAQLLRGRGVHLLPAAAAVRDGWAVLMLCPFTLEPELRVMIRAGYRIIGQRWTAVREEEGRLALLHMPGGVERAGGHRSHLHDGNGGACDEPDWEDLTAGRGWSRQEHAFCDAVLIAEPGRRACAQARELSASEAPAHLRRAWPLPDPRPSRGPCQLPVQLARHCRCASAQLSRDPKDVLELLSAMRDGPVRLDWSDAWQDARGPLAGAAPPFRLIA